MEIIENPFSLEVYVKLTFLPVWLSTLFVMAASIVWAQAPINVVVSMHPHFDLVRQLAGDAAQVSRILPLGASPHTFDPSPRDVARIADADLVVMNGSIDDWLLELVTASGTGAEVVTFVNALEFDPITGEAHERGEEDHEADHADEHAERAEAHDHDGTNPHLWLDPVLMVQAVPVLVDALSEADPANADLYTTNGKTLVASLEALHSELSQTLAPVQDAPFVPFHDAWPYFVRRYGLNQVAVIEPAPGREPSPKYLAEVLEILQETGATAIFTDVQLPARPAEIVAESAGLALYTLDPEGGGRDDASYQAFMRANATTIAEALAR